VVGVAPSIPLTSIKVLGCTGSGSVSNIVKAIDWVSANGVKPAIINMSLGGGESLAMDQAVENAVKQGITVVVAAGNNAADACTSSPARMGRLDGVITVAAIDNTGSEASFSNYGECVDIWAPGVNILSTSMNGGTATMSGTSMATPHVVGVASLYRAKFPNYSPAMVEQSLKNDAIINRKQSKDGISIKVINAANY
jgi:serine protease